MKFIRYFLNIPNKEQDRLFGLTNATSDSPAIEDIKPFIPFLRLFKVSIELVSQTWDCGASHDAIRHRLLYSQ